MMLSQSVRGRIEMNGSSKPFVLCSLVFLTLFAVSDYPSCAGGTDDALAKVAEADNAVRQAFVAILEAEEAGANVSDLIVKLQGAGTFLAGAEIAYTNGDANGAAAKAESALSIAESVKPEALSLKSSALADAQTAFRQTLIFSFAGAAAFLAVLVFAWILLKRVHVKKMLKMKPEVTPHAKA